MHQYTPLEHCFSFVLSSWSLFVPILSERRLFDRLLYLRSLKRNGSNKIVCIDLSSTRGERENKERKRKMTQERELPGRDEIDDSCKTCKVKLRRVSPWLIKLEVIHQKNPLVHWTCQMDLILVHQPTDPCQVLRLDCQHLNLYHVVLPWNLQHHYE